MAKPTKEESFLAAGISMLEPVLSPRGFTYSPSDSGVSSGGPFAVGTFRREPVAIGLIVRRHRHLGCPNYSIGQGFAGHADLVAALGKAGNEQLVAGDDLEFVARNGGDAFDALREDLQSIVLPALGKSLHDFKDAVQLAVQAGHRRLGF